MSSADYRTKRQKLEAMANQTASPNEAAVAKRKLAAMDAHPIFARPEKKFSNPETQAMWEHTRDMPHEEFMEWLRKQQEKGGVPSGKRRYRSNTDPRAVSHGSGPPPPSMHDDGPDDD